MDKLSLSGTGLDFDDLVISVSRTSAVITTIDRSISVTILNAAGLIDASDFVEVPEFQV